MSAQADVDFILQIVADVVSQLGGRINMRRLYVTGHGSGCAFAQRLVASGAPGLFAACACASAALDTEPSRSFTPTPFMLVHGMLDAIVPYDGIAVVNTSEPTASPYLPSALDTVAIWARINECHESGTYYASGPPLVREDCATSSGDSVDRSFGGVAYWTSHYWAAGCTSSSETVLISLPNVGHRPYLHANPLPSEHGTPGMGSSSVATHELMWAFMRRFTKPAAAAVLPSPTCEAMPTLCSMCFAHSRCLLPGANCVGLPQPPPFCAYCTPYIACMPIEAPLPPSPIPPPQPPTPSKPPSSPLTPPSNCGTPQPQCLQCIPFVHCLTSYDPVTCAGSPSICASTACRIYTPCAAAAGHTVATSPPPPLPPPAAPPPPLNHVGNFGCNFIPSVCNACAPFAHCVALGTCLAPATTSSSSSSPPMYYPVPEFCGRSSIIFRLCADSPPPLPLPPPRPPPRPPPPPFAPPPPQPNSTNLTNLTGLLGQDISGQTTGDLGLPFFSLGEAVGIAVGALVVLILCCLGVLLWRQNSSGPNLWRSERPYRPPKRAHLYVPGLQRDKIDPMANRYTETEQLAGGGSKGSIGCNSLFPSIDAAAARAANLTATLAASPPRQTRRIVGSASPQGKEMMYMRSRVQVDGSSVPVDEFDDPGKVLQTTPPLSDKSDDASSSSPQADAANGQEATAQAEVAAAAPTETDTSTLVALAAQAVQEVQSGREPLAAPQEQRKTTEDAAIDPKMSLGTHQASGSPARMKRSSKAQAKESARAKILKRALRFPLSSAPPPPAPKTTPEVAASTFGASGYAMRFARPMEEEPQEFMEADVVDDESILNPAFTPRAVVTAAGEALDAEESLLEEGAAANQENASTCLASTGANGYARRFADGIDSSDALLERHEVEAPKEPAQKAVSRLHELVADVEADVRFWNDGIEQQQQQLLLLLHVEEAAVASATEEDTEGRERQDALVGADGDVPGPGSRGEAEVEEWMQGHDVRRAHQPEPDEKAHSGWVRPGVKEQGGEPACSLASAAAPTSSSSSALSAPAPESPGPEDLPAEDAEELGEGAARLKRASKRGKAGKNRGDTTKMEVAWKSPQAAPSERTLSLLGDLPQLPRSALRLAPLRGVAQGAPIEGALPPDETRGSQKPTTPRDLPPDVGMFHQARIPRAMRPPPKL